MTRRRRDDDAGLSVGRSARRAVHHPQNRLGNSLRFFVCVRIIPLYVRCLFYIFLSIRFFVVVVVVVVAFVVARTRAEMADQVPVRSACFPAKTIPYFFFVCVCVLCLK